MPGQITYQSEKYAKKKVVFSNGTGADVTLRKGYAVCYDGSLGTAAECYTVIRPATDYLRYFAGLITAEYDGKVVANGAKLNIDICIPTQWGQVVEAWITEDHSGDRANLEITNGSFALTEGATTKVARTVQLVNRNTTNGTCRVRLYGVSHAVAVA